MATEKTLLLLVNLHIMLLHFKMKTIFMLTTVYRLSTSLGYSILT